MHREQPSLIETQRRLPGIIVKYSEAEKKKPTFKRMKNPVLIPDLGVFPVANTKVKAKDAGGLSRQQIDTFKRMQNPKACV
ncbi:hypothetical protein V7S43_012882 [Phytophthora oleae]|uniref:Uncharacterized protein n=1 Tax=Phytophthora oleae TaxID=2107226 RepID=A0ABD3F7Y7_9STRA